MPVKARQTPKPRKPKITSSGVKQAHIYDYFAEGWLCHTDKKWYGKPFALENWQWDGIWKPVFATLNPDGTRWYNRVLIGEPREHGKSEIAARIVLTIMLMEPVPNGEYGIIASSEKQAGVVFEKVTTMIRLNPELSAKFEILKKTVVVRDTGARFGVYPATEASVQGLHFTVCVIDEMHVHRNTSIYSAVSSGMDEDSSLLIIISTAAASRKGPLWDHVIPRFLADPHAYVYWIGAQTLQQQIAGVHLNYNDKRLWRKAAVASWHTKDRVAKKYRDLPLSEFIRYILNVFPPEDLGADMAFSASSCNRCLSTEPFDWSRTLSLGIDGATSGDSFALVFTTPDIDDSATVHAYPIIYDEPGENGYYDLVQIEDLIYEYWSEYSLERIGIDPAWLMLLAQHLKDRYGIPIESYSQSDVNMANASSYLKRLLDERRLIMHGPDAAKCIAHMKAAVRGTARAHGWRMTKDGNKSKIDGAIATSISAILLDAVSGGDYASMYESF
jgi:phage terminase large subunit-like protein